MLPTFLLFHAECVNEYVDSVCHLVLIPVEEGIKQTPIEFFFNPEATFDFVCSGISELEVNSFPRYSEEWKKAQEIFSRFDMAVCSAEGYSARAMYNTLMRVKMEFPSIHYCNAKAICRRTLDEVSYSFDYLSSKFYGDIIERNEPVRIAQRWCDLVLKGLEKHQGDDISKLLHSLMIKPGLISVESFEPSLCNKLTSGTKARANFDPEGVEVEEDQDNPFFGMNVVFTGKMESMKRDDARKAVIRIGGFAPEQLTQETDFLVVGVQDLRVVGEKGLSGKMKKAAKYREKGLPIEIIDERDFIEMISKKSC